ncbi:uncharacterized protein SAMN02745751_01280 [Dethiosulfatibacter aminovorans DSM 17477]|uniref:Radical SAM core domain-containing protein n=1 Tax=Dethiosulfatibacter aminovorans DSM 17477 TaxID=1121476 RepID=A0A1M6EXP6_9FIRM|nr:anaerobic sulfatase maturase [Dethiosulfatibacter aminovorans]SHI90267.1 uncharacterized protein SAMN02745751_01280 [Dethiosulfatibacter aminovorans DSM 17477]
MIKQEQIGKGFHVLAKPIGPVCNLDCRYCFYTEKEVFFDDNEDFRMNDKVLETFIRKYITSQDIPEIQFVWQGGEPTLMGLNFFRKVVAFQRRHGGGKKIINSLQTNGTLLDDEWCKFLKENMFLVGLSLDGPDIFHNLYRIDKMGNPTLEKVMDSVSLLKKYEVPFNVLVCVTKESSRHPLKIYKFLKQNELEYIQFTPIVERIPDEKDRARGLSHSSPRTYGDSVQNTNVTNYSVEATEYGDFLIGIFDEWVKNDVGSIYIMNFEWALESWLGLPSTMCLFSEECGKAVTIEHSGDVYTCDHYVYPEYKLGNILDKNLKEMIYSDKQKDFGKNKIDALPKSCKACEVYFACKGECPKNRFIKTYNGEDGLNYLCEGYKKYFRHIHPYMKVMVELIKNNLSPSMVMDAAERPIVIFKDDK